MKKYWTSESAMFAVAIVLLGATGGAFMLVPAAMFAILMTGHGAVSLVVAAAGIGTTAFVRALVLQSRRYARQHE